MSEHDNATNEAAAPKKDAGFLASIDGTLLSRFAAIALLTSLVLGGLVFMSMRSLSGSADQAIAEAQDGLDPDGVAAVEALADQVSSTSSRMLLFIAAVAVVSLGIAVALSRATAKRVVAPMIELREAARGASGALPAFVQACEAGDGQVPTLPTIEIASGGVAADIAASFNELQRNAANLAVTQTFRRTRDGGRFVDLGRSTEQLLNDQMRFIEAMEHDETSAANLQRLFRIDHLASRMRRNAASMLVLADRDTPREFTRPVSIHQVVQAASSGIEHFERVAMSDLSGVAVNGTIAADLAHLLAELLETATAASESTTEVSGQPTADGFIVAITDHGSAAGPAELAAINQCMADPRVADATPRTAMTHAVIARLAKRHDVTVEMHPSSAGGVTTQIHLPQIALARLTGSEVTPATPSDERPETPAPVAAPPHMPADVAAPDDISELVTDDGQGLASPPVADVVDRVDGDLHDPVPPEAATVSEAGPVSEAGAAPEAGAPAAADDTFTSITAVELEPAPAASAPAEAAPAEPAPAEPVPAEPAPADPVLAEPVPAAEPAPAGVSAADAESAALAERWRVLASGQRAAIEWAMDVDNSDSSTKSAALRPGPVDAATLAQLDTSTEG